MFGKAIVFELFEMISKKEKMKSENRVPGLGRVGYGGTGHYKWSIPGLLLYLPNTPTTNTMSCLVKN